MYNYILIQKNNIWSHLSSTTEILEAEVATYFRTNLFHDLINISNPDKPYSVVMKYQFRVAEPS